MNQSCIEARHAALDGGQHLPVRTAVPKPNGQLGTLKGAPPTVSIAEVVCSPDNRDSSHEAAVRLASAALRWSLPLVLRGCAAGMPAIERWRNDTYIRTRAARAFAPVLARKSEGAHEFTGNLDDLDVSLLVDTWWPQPLGEALWKFATEAGSKGLWVSAGAKRAAAHYDTFDNLHVVVNGAKEFRLVSPQAAASMYVDFPPGGHCPDYGSFGCDDLGCFAFVPFNADDVDLATYPRVADVQVLPPRMACGQTRTDQTTQTPDTRGP